MKKSIVLAVLGLSAGVVSSYGQGFIQFNSYAAHNSSSYVAVYGDTANGGTLNAAVANGTFTIELLYSTTAINESASSSYGALNAGWLVASTGTSDNTGVPGTAYGPNFSLPSYVAGTQVYFEFAAYSGAAYGTAGDYAGHSASFHQGMQGPAELVWYADGNPSSGAGSGSGILAPTYSVFSVPVSSPEPSSLALAGLGGFGMLMAFRRKKA
jgi:hypothetical protein